MLAENINLVNNLKTYLAKTDTSVTAFAKKCGVKTSTVANILNGYTKSPSIEIVVKFCDGMNITLDELVINREHDRNNIQRLFNLMKDIDEHDREIILSMISGAINARRLQLSA